MVAAIVLAAVVKGPAEATLSDPRSGFEIHPVPNQGMGQADTGSNMTVTSENHARANADLRFDHRPGTDSCPGVDGDEGSDDCTLA